MERKIEQPSRLERNIIKVVKKDREGLKERYGRLEREIKRKEGRKGREGLKERYGKLEREIKKEGRKER